MPIDWEANKFGEGFYRHSFKAGSKDMISIVFNKKLSYENTWVSRFAVADKTSDEPIKSVEFNKEYATEEEALTGISAAIEEYIAANQ